MKMNVAYLRVSTEAQTEKFGLDIQRQKILDFCEKNGVKIDKWYVDGGFSGSKLDRPQINELLNDASRNLIDCVYIYKLDRMSRDVVDTLILLYKTLPEYGVKIISMTEELKFDSPMDKAMITFNAAMNQYEREMIYMRTRAGMVERVKKGYWMGGGRIPFGYYYDRNDGILHPKEDEVYKVQQMYSLYLEGYSCDRISRMLGMKSENIVHNILCRKSNLGYIEYKGEVYKGRHEPIIDESTFYEVQALMEKRSTNSHVSNGHVLTGLCYCGECGARMRYHKWDGNPKLICYSQVKGKEYMSRSDHCCNIRPIAKDIESEVEACFKEFAINVAAGNKPDNRVANLERLIKKSVSKVKKLYNVYAENDSPNLLSVIREEEVLIKNMEEQLENEKRKDSDCSYKIKEIKRMSDIWDDLTTKEKNKILKTCVEKIVIDKDDIEIHFIAV